MDYSCPLFNYDYYGTCIAHDTYIPSVTERKRYCFTDQFKSCPMHNVKEAKKIRVIFHNDRGGVVDKEHLDRLLWEEKIKEFYRSDGWVVIGCDPVRIRKQYYNGPERRKLL
ncbi:MAG: GSU3473 family protein [Nitrospirota bacterium]